jgi:succinate dehydrogenase/fumarate reductase flavoprotein subunit
MGMGAGGAAIRMSMGSVTLPFYPPKKLMRGIFVNQHGPALHARGRVPGPRGRDRAAAAGRSRVARARRRELRAAGVRGRRGPRRRDDRGARARARLRGGQPQATVALYNAGAERGEDPVFHKAAEHVAPLRTPPFGAIDLSWDKAIYACFTLGGLATDTEARVLNADGAPVPGLWAAGRTAASISSPGYSSGTSIGEAQIFGRIAGISAAQGG